MFTEEQARRGSRQHRGKKAGKRREWSKMDTVRWFNIDIGYWKCRSAKQRGPELERIVYDFLPPEQTPYDIPAVIQSGQVEHLEGYYGQIVQKEIMDVVK